MKGYFSQLARRTGVHFTGAARSKSAAPHDVGASAVGANAVGANAVGANAVGANAVGANAVDADAVGANAAGANAADSHIRGSAQHLPTASPLHVEEVTLVAPRVNGSLVDEPNVVQGEAARTTQAAQAAAETSGPELAPPFHQPFAETTVATVHLGPSRNETRAPTAPPIRTENLQRLSTEHQSPLTRRDAERDQISGEPVDEVDRVATGLSPSSSKTTRPLASSLQLDQPTDVSAQPANDLNPRDPIGREILVRQYLREVREWVAAPPTLISDLPEKEVTQPNSQGQAESIASEREREPSQAATQATQPDVHETSLSIGSISVVIEDSKPAATTIAPTPSAPKTQPQTQPEPISLSRYYLQRW